jgi:hypothetical protein
MGDPGLSLRLLLPQILGQGIVPVMAAIAAEPVVEILDTFWLKQNVG